MFLQLKCRFPVFRGGGGSPSRGVLHLGGVSPSEGVLHLGGFSMGGFSIWGALHPGGVLCPSRGVLHPGGFSIQGGVPCDLSHHAFDVTCMLSPNQLRLTNSAAAYIVVVQGMMGYPPPC